MYGHRNRRGERRTGSSDGAEAYSNQEYILDAEHFTGVEFTTREKEMDEQCRKQKRYEHER